MVAPLSWFLMIPDGKLFIYEWDSFPKLKYDLENKFTSPSFGKQILFVASKILNSHLERSILLLYYYNHGSKGIFAWLSQPVPFARNPATTL